MTATDQINFLSTCPTVGRETAQAVVAFLGSLDSDHKRLTTGKIPGVSSARGKKISRWIKTNYKP